MMTWLNYDSNATMRQGSKRRAMRAKLLKQAAVAKNKGLHAIQL
jgi:hypothetical protein